MYYVIIAVVSGISGFVAGYFVMRNNPKYFNIDDMLKNLKKEKLAEVKAKAEELLKKV